MVGLFNALVGSVLILSIGDYLLNRSQSELGDKLSLITIVLCAVALYFVNKY